MDEDIPTTGGEIGDPPLDLAERISSLLRIHLLLSVFTLKMQMSPIP